MNLRFTKMHGLGNDFMVVDGISQPLPDDMPLGKAQIRRLADRHFGVGFDQLLVVQPARTPGVDFRYRVFNADGSEVSQCGNGARCFARFIRENGLAEEHDIRVETAAGQLTLHVTDDEQVTVNMGQPLWQPEDVPFVADHEADTYVLTHEGEAWEASVVGLGNPHCVLLVEDLDKAPVSRVGPLLESHRDFPERVNVGFMQILSRDHIRLRVYERGAGETLACGSGACAAAVCGQRRGLLDETVRVDLRGGSLMITHHPDGPILMTGPATRVYDGEVIVEG